jgi:hypothetical protein
MSQRLGITCRAGDGRSVGQSRGPAADGTKLRILDRRQSPAAGGARPDRRTTMESRNADERWTTDSLPRRARARRRLRQPPGNRRGDDGSARRGGSRARRHGPPSRCDQLRQSDSRQPRSRRRAARGVRRSRPRSRFAARAADRAGHVRLGRPGRRGGQGAAGGPGVRRHRSGPRRRHGVHGALCGDRGRVPGPRDLAATGQRRRRSPRHACASPSGAAVPTTCSSPAS